MQMYTGMTSHIVFFTRIGEEVGLGTCLNTGIEE